MRREVPKREDSAMQMRVRRTQPWQNDIGGNRQNLAHPVARPRASKQTRRIHAMRSRLPLRLISKPDKPRQMNFAEIAAIWPSPLPLDMEDALDDPELTRAA